MHRQERTGGFDGHQAEAQSLVVPRIRSTHVLQGILNIAAVVAFLATLSPRLSCEQGTGARPSVIPWVKRVPDSAPGAFGGIVLLPTGRA